jgi:hypothetical protein
MIPQTPPPAAQCTIPGWGWDCNGIPGPTPPRKPFTMVRGDGNGSYFDGRRDVASSDMLYGQSPVSAPRLALPTQRTEETPTGWRYQ